MTLRPSAGDLTSLGGITTNKVKRFRVLPLCSVTVAALGIIVGPAPTQADSGCPNGLVPRNAQPGDQVCVTQQVASEVAQENANAAGLRQPGGGAYGPLTCKPGYVWREAFVGDGVCVTPDRRQETLNENESPAIAPPPQLPNPAPPPNATTPANPPSTSVGPLPTTLPTTSAAPTPLPSPTQLPTTTPLPPANSCDPRVDICVH